MQMKYYLYVFYIKYSNIILHVPSFWNMTGYRERIRCSARRHFNLTTPEIVYKWGCVYGHSTAGGTLFEMSL